MRPYPEGSPSRGGRATARSVRPTCWTSLPDAASPGPLGGGRVYVRSRYGETVLPVHLTTVRRGELFTTFHTPLAFTNRVTSSHRDPVAGPPEYKVSAVALEKIS